MIDLETMSVLIVDDMKSMRRTIRNMFKQLKLGKNIRHAENGREGWKLLKSIPVDMAVIDWNMPVMNGIELLGRIREDRDLRDMPVIMITAESEKDIVVEVAESEIDAYLLKPLTMKALDRKVRIIVHNANHPDDLTLSLRRARTLEEEGRIPEAIDQIREALREKPNASRILRKMAVLHTKISKDAIAEKCFKKAVAVNKNDAVTRYLLGDFYWKKEDLDSAARYIIEALAISPRAVPRAMELGDQLIKKGKTDKAFDLFDKAISRSLDANAAKEGVVAIYMDNGEYWGAKKMLKSLINSQPDRYDLVFKLGVVCEKLWDLEGALEQFKKVDENIENHVDAKLHIAWIYFDRKKTYATDDVIREILKIEPDNADALELRGKNT